MKLPSERIKEIADRTIANVVKTLESNEKVNIDGCNINAIVTYLDEQAQKDREDLLELKNSLSEKPKEVIEDCNDTSHPSGCFKDKPKEECNRPHIERPTPHAGETILC